MKNKGNYIHESLDNGEGVIYIQIIGTGDLSMWTIYQDSPAYGCDDNPSYRWYGYKTEANGHISKNIGPFDLRRQAFEATQASRLEKLTCVAKGDPAREDTQAAKRLLEKR